MLGELERPVDVILSPGGPSVAELAEAGVARISVGSALWRVGSAAVTDAAGELLSSGTDGDDRVVRAGVDAARSSFR